MANIISVTIKLKDQNFTLDIEEAKELYKILDELLNTRSDLQDLADLFKKKEVERTPIFLPQPYPYPIYPRPYHWWEIQWTTIGEPIISTMANVDYQIKESL